MKDKISPCILYLFLIIVIFNGFITNFIHVGSFSTGTLVCDAWIVLMLFYCLAKFRQIAIPSGVMLLLSWFIVMIVGVMLICGFAWSSMYETLAGIRNHILYPLVFVLVWMLASRANEKQILKWILIMCMLIDLFGIFQYLFASRLPERMLIVDGAVNFKIQGLAEYRSTGLVGDMIAFGGFTVITMVLLLGYLQYYRRSRLEYLWVIIPAAACVLTYNRTSIAGMLLVFVIAFLGFGARRIHVRTLVLIALLIVLLAILMNTDIGASIFTRFTNGGVNAESNNQHFSTYSQAIEQIKEYPLVGLGMGTQLASSKGGRVVFDGYWWECLLELGIPAFIPVIGFFAESIRLTAASFLHTDDPEMKLISGGYLFSAIYFLVASVLNSSFEARTNFCLMMILLGIYIGLRQKRAYRAPAESKHGHRESISHPCNMNK